MMRALATLLFVAGVSACMDGGITAHAENDEVTATVSRLRVRHLDWGDIVLGHLKIRGIKQKIVSADLECFALQVGAFKSKEIWVDSYMSIAQWDYPARGDTVYVDVYWPMKDFKAGTDEDLRKVTLSIIKKPSSPCFKWGPDPVS